MFAHVRQLVALAYEGYTDSEGNVFSGDRGSFDITDKFSGICPAEHSLVHPTPSALCSYDDTCTAWPTIPADITVDITLVSHGA